MGASPLACWRARDGRPAPLPVDLLKEGFIKGAVLVEGSGSPRAEPGCSSYVEWANGAAEVSLLAQEGADGEAYGLWLSPFTSMMVIHRLHGLARSHGMAIAWGVAIVTDAGIARHYADDRDDGSSIEVVSSFEELTEIMAIRWVTCPPEAADVR